MKKYIDWDDVKKRGVELFDEMQKSILSGERSQELADHVYRGKQMPTREAGKYLRDSLDMVRDGIEEGDSKKVGTGLFRMELYIAHNSNRIIRTSHYQEDRRDFMTPEQRAVVEEADSLRKAIGPIDVRIVDLVRKVRAEASGGNYYVRRRRKKKSG